MASVSAKACDVGAVKITRSGGSIKRVSRKDVNQNNTFSRELPNPPILYEDLKAHYSPSVLNVIIRKPYLKYYKVLRDRHPMGKKHFTIMEAISISVFGDLLRVKELTKKVHQYVKSDVDANVAKDVLEAVSKHKLYHDKKTFFNLIADALKINLAVWGTSFNGRVEMFGNFGKDVATGGLATTNGYYNPVIQCADRPLASALEVAVEVTQERDQTERVSEHEPKTIENEYLGVKVQQVLPAKMSEECFKNPGKYVHLFEKTTEKCGIAVSRPSKTVWEKYKPSLRNPSEMNPLPFQKQVTEMLTPEIARINHLDPNKDTKIKLQNLQNLQKFLNEDKRTQFDYKMPIVKALWKKKEAYYCFSEENHLIAGWRNGFNLKYIGCDAFGNVYGSNEVEGVTTWWYYIGTRYSTFCIHREDRNFKSINILLGGCCKVWFALSAKDTVRLEKLLKARLRAAGCEYDLSCENFLQHKDLFPDPSWLIREGFRVYSVKQEPSDVVWTGYGCLHWGLNTGVNFAAATNLCDKQWMDHYHTQPVCIHEGKHVVDNEQLFTFFDFFENGKWSDHLDFDDDYELPQDDWLKIDLPEELSDSDASPSVSDGETDQCQGASMPQKTLGTDTKQPSTSSAIGKRPSVSIHKSGNKRARMATSPKHAQEADVEEESPLSPLRTQPSRPDLLIEPPNIIPPQQQSMSQCLEGEDFRLPLQTEEDLNRFLVYLNDKGNFDKMCKRQANVGGEAKFTMTKQEMITRNILENLISNELSKQMTLTGAVKSKRNAQTPKMEGTNLQRLLQESVRKNEGAERVSDWDINKYTQHWFRGASDRKGGRKARQKLERAPCVEPDESD